MSYNFENICINYFCYAEIYYLKLLTPLSKCGLFSYPKCYHLLYVLAWHEGLGSPSRRRFRVRGRVSAPHIPINSVPGLPLHLVKCLIFDCPWSPTYGLYNGLLWNSISSYLQQTARISTTVATVGSAFPSDIRYTLGRLYLFTNLLGCNSP